MKKILLLGDSIRMGYQAYVKELLADEYEVIYPEDNGRFASYTLWQVNQLFKLQKDIALVHWNNGYWDMNIEYPMTEAMHPEEEYLHFLRRIIALIRKADAKIIFATTTPILENGTAKDISGVDANINYDNEWVKKYNTAAKELMLSEKIPVNDLYKLCMEDEHRYKCSDLLHLTDEGYRRCAQQVAKIIRKELIVK